MRARTTLIRPALVLALVVSLAGATAGSTAAAPVDGPDTSSFQKLSAPIAPVPATEGADAPADESVARATALSSPAFPDTEWATFRDLNLTRINYAGVNPVIRHGALDSLATTWVNSQSNSTDPQLDDNIESKVPAGSLGGVQLMYSYVGGTTAEMQEFLDWITVENLRYDAIDPELTDSGIGIAATATGLYAYYIIVGYTHSTPASDELPLYRFYKPSAGTHFYSTSAGERNTVIGFPEYRYEGLVAYIKGPQATSTTVPLQDLNRFFLASAGTHFYTSAPAEYQAVLTYPQYSLDGVAGRVAAAPGTGLSAMHRFFRPASGTHFYSANPAEVEAVKGLPGYTYEGTAFFLRVAS
ncbi:hypothetical protein [Cellulomonas xylanilytica]|uniref:DUF5648 domain-containing protein n=1 Tax=Cellulomonas xylanilytica TaxID=233583 RepID=A0A510V8Q1_9CELL|nr:hypothetical protein [Cellulomonas xylanilytica]GEK21640.1 hypothetical protein CXY01_21600 [Cellulomonas xylanilytica]